MTKPLKLVHRSWPLSREISNGKYIIDSYNATLDGPSCSFNILHGSRSFRYNTFAKFG